MIKKRNKYLIVCFALIFLSGAIRSQVLSRALLKADKLFIKKEYELASGLYVQYLKKSPKEYYASRQAAICFDRINDHYSAIDHWPAVIESSEVTEEDYLSYAQCLLINDREPEARKLFALLAASKNKEIGDWGRSYLKKENFYADTALCRVREVEALNTSNSESCPLALSGKFIFLSNKGKTQRAFTPSNDPPFQRLNVMALQDSLVFSGISIYEKLEQLALWGQVCFNTEGTQFIYSKPVTNSDKNDGKGVSVSYQLFFLNLGTLNEKTPETKAFRFNSFNHDILHPALSNDGNLLYFASNMKGSLGGKDIFVCVWENNDWSNPVNLGPSVNSSGDELFPTVGETVNSTIPAMDVRVLGVLIFSAPILWKIRSHLIPPKTWALPLTAATMISHCVF